MNVTYAWNLNSTEKQHEAMSNSKNGRLLVPYLRLVQLLSASNFVPPVAA